jgi:hypothetical protein
VGFSGLTGCTICANIVDSLTVWVASHCPRPAKGVLALTINLQANCSSSDGRPSARAAEAASMFSLSHKQLTGVHCSGSGSTVFVQGSLVQAYGVAPGGMEHWLCSTNCMAGNVVNLLCRRVVAQRYICWMHTTPTMLVLVAMMSHSLTKKQASPYVTSCLGKALGNEEICS